MGVPRHQPDIHGVEIHDAEIQDQFTRQAEPFLRRHAGGKQDLLERMADCAQPRREDTLLDVACGPGIVSCFFAERVSRVTGLDAVPAMLESARRLQDDRGLTNIEWVHGQATALPFRDAAFDCAVTRFSFHHYLDPGQALREMKRVCRRGGTILVADVTPSPETQDRLNEWEILRDPSHIRALTEAEFASLGESAGLVLHRVEQFGLAMDLEDLLAGSFPWPGDAGRLRALFQEDIRTGANRLGVAARDEAGAIRLSYPVTVLAWRRSE
ncbi:MAG TPA: methyltransferase domain-containing protein [Terracidiphilus sp.]|nr:methyltransferase domain-containing protein [Terracidiphilus sp.]